MKILLDEDVPIQVPDLLRRVLPTHTVDHVDALQWKGKHDVSFLRDAAQRGYEAIVTNDKKQLADPDECDAIKASGMHHVRYAQRTPGLEGLALAIASIIAAMPTLIAALTGADGQRLAQIVGISRTERFKMSDPKVDPPPYWR